MFTIEADKTINITRGDSASFVVPIEYAFQSGDVLRFKVFRKKACEDVVLQKDFVIEEATESVSIVLTEQDTRIGKVISKPVDYWYEIELNPENNPQTLIGYDDDGAKIFRLYPEGRDIEDDELTEEEKDTLRKILTEFKEDEIPAVAQDYMEEQIPSITQDYVNKNVFPVVDDPEVWELLEGLYKVSGFVAIDNEGVGFYVADKSLLVVNKDGDKTLFYLYLGGYDDFPYDIIIGATDGTTADWYGVESERKKVYEINDKSTHEGYPSAKAVYDLFGNIEVSGGVGGFSPTAKVEQTDEGATITITDKNGTTNATVLNGKDGTNGTDGKDGLSATHSWNGTVLTVISASGTSSADLKGDKGEKGDKGDPYTLTEADKAEIAKTVEENAKGDIVQSIIAELQGLPVFGTVDENNIITVTSQLSGGTYTLKYENEDGTTTDIGTITIEGKVVIVNLLENAVGADGAVFNGVGYTDGYYLTGSNNVTPIYVQAETGAAHFVTGYIPYTTDQLQAQTPIYIKGANIDITNSHERICLYPSLEYNAWLDPVKLSSNHLQVTELADMYYRITLPTNMLEVEGGYFTESNYVRLSLSGSGEGAIITVGQEIPD